MFVKTFWSIQNSKQLKVCSTTLNLVIQQMDKACFSGWAPGNTQGGQHEAGQWIIWMWSAGCWAGLGTCQLSEWQNTELKDLLMTARKSPREGPSSLHFHVLDFFPLSFREWAEREESPRKQHYIRYKNLCLPYVASQTLGEEWERKSQPWRTKRVFPASSLCSQPIRLEIKGSAHQCGFQGPCSVSRKRLKMSDIKSSHKKLCPWKFSYCLLEEEITSTAPALATGSAGASCTPVSRALAMCLGAAPASWCQDNELINGRNLPEDEKEALFSWDS